MSDEKMKVEIGLEVQSTGEELVDALTRKLDALNRRIKSIASAAVAIGRSVSSPGGTSSPTTGTNANRSARDALGFDRQAISQLRQKLSLQGRLLNQQVRQERETFSAYKARMSFQARAEAQEIRAIRAKASEEARAFRQRFCFTSKMARQAIQEERNAARERTRSIADAARQEERRSRDMARSIRENARLESAENRRVDRERSARESARSRGYSSIRQGASDVREGAGRAVRGAGAVSAVAAAGTGAAVRRGVSTRMGVDSSEVGISIFSGKTKAQIAEARRGFLDNEAIRNGLSVKDGLDVWSETLKAGIQEADKVTGVIMRGVAGLELNAKETTRLTALVDRNYGSASTPEKLKSALNAVAVAAREDPTQSSEIIEGVKRGFGVMSTGNWTPEQLAAAVSGGQSVGIQPGKAGTFIGTAGKRLSLGASSFLGPKQRKELDFAAKEFGFANSKAMASAYSKDSFNVFMESMRLLKAMAPDKAAQVSQALYGTQWSDEALQFGQGSEGVDKTYREITDGKNANFLDEAARQRAESLQGRWNSTKAIFGRFWDAFGAGFEDILTSINQYFLDLNASFDYQKIKGYVSEFVEGVREAFGVSTWKELLQSTFGGNIGNIGTDIRAFGRGLAEGILGIGRVIRSVMTVFGGSGGGAETIGRLSGQFVALSLALVALGPVVGILGGLASIIAGIAVAGRGLAGLAGLGAGAAGMGAAGAFRGIGLLLSKAFGLAVVAEIGANRGIISTWLLDAGKSLLTAAIEGLKAALSRDAITAAMKAVVAEMVPAPLQRWMESNGQEEKKSLPGRVLDGLGKPPVPVAPTERGVIGRAWDWLSESLIGSAKASEIEGRPSGPGASRLEDAINANTDALKANAEPVSGLSSLTKRTAYNAIAPADAARSSIILPANQVRSVLSGSTAGGSSYGPGPLSSSVPGSALNGGSGLSRRGIIGGGVSSSSFSGLPSSGATGAYKPVLDFIAGTEGTAGKGDYNASLGYGKFLPGGKEQNLTGKTLDQIDALQTGMLNHPSNGFNSSAIGRYQIVRKTLRGLRSSLGLKGTDLYNESMQDRLGAELVRQRGANAGGLGKEWASLRGGKAQQAAALVGQIPHGASTTPTARPLADSMGGNVGSGVAAAVADNAAKLVGMGSSQSAQALGSKMTPGQWCADFVNGSLKSANIKGVNSSIANSFLGWGREVTDGIRKGDVLVESRGRGVGNPGGHVGLATGETRQGPRGLQAEMISGNYGNRVGRSWTDMSKLTGRRAITGETEDIAAGIKASGWKPGAGGNAGALGSDASAPLGRDTPLRVGNTAPIGGGSGGGSGQSSTTTNTITIQGAGQDAESIANAVQRKLNDKMNRRTTDFSPSALSV